MVGLSCSKNQIRTTKYFPSEKSGHQIWNTRKRGNRRSEREWEWGWGWCVENNGEELIHGIIWSYVSPPHVEKSTLIFELATSIILVFLVCNLFAFLVPFSYVFYFIFWQWLFQFVLELPRLFFFFFFI